METVSNTKSIKRKHINDEIKDEEGSDHSNDSENSLDQLLDENFIANKKNKYYDFSPISSKSLKRDENDSPRKYIKSNSKIRSLRATGGKRAKAMVIMASNKKKTPNKQQSKKQYKKIRKQLNYDTNYNKNYNKNYRKIITPTPNPKRRQINIENNNNDIYHNKSKNQFLFETPKKMNKFKNIQTPLTPTPVKLIRKLNVKTPIKECKEINHDNNIKKINKDNKSWKDIEYDKKNKNEKNKNKKDLNKYKLLLSQTRILPLPIKYNILFEKFNALESTLSLYQRKNSFFVNYQNIETSVTTICKKKFLQKDLQQILTIMPEFYYIQWTLSFNKLKNKKDLKLTITAIDFDIENHENNDEYNDDDENDENDKNDKKNDETVTKKNNHEIGMKFLKVSKMKERENLFRLRLIKFIKYHHKQWLIKNVMIEFDPFQTGKWHKRFDLENVENIKLKDLPSKPIKDIDKIEKMINEQNEKLNDVINKEKEKENEKQKNKIIPNHLKHLSPTLVAKIRAKENNQKIRGKMIKKKVDDEDDIDNDVRLQQLPYLVNLMRGIYVSLRKSSMPCNDLIVLIKKRHRNHHILNEEIWKQLQILNKLKSRFFKIKQGPMIKVAKLNKKISTKDVLNEINNKLK